MGGPPKDAIERKRRALHGKRTKQGIKEAKARKRTVKRAKQALRSTTKQKLVQRMFDPSKMR